MPVTSELGTVIEEAKRLLDGITSGDWYVERKYDGGCTLAMMREWSKQRIALAVHGPNAWVHRPGAQEQIAGNAAFIAAAPRLVRSLLAEVERLSALLATQATVQQVIARWERNADLLDEANKGEWADPAAAMPGTRIAAWCQNCRYSRQRPVAKQAATEGLI